MNPHLIDDLAKFAIFLALWAIFFALWAVFAYSAAKTALTRRRKMSKAKWQKLPRKPYRRGDTYRAARKAKAKELKYIWRELPRTHWNGGIFVVVPEA